MAAESKKWSYANIKASVVVEYNNRSLVCEIQFIMDWMIKFQKNRYRIYEITRNKDFVENVAKLSGLYSVKNEEACVLANRGKTYGLSKLMVGNPCLKYKSPEREASIIHSIAELGNLKMLKLVLSSVVSEKEYHPNFETLSPIQKELINTRAFDKSTLLICAARGGNANIVRVE